MSEGQYALEAVLEMELERDLYAQSQTPTCNVCAKSMQAREGKYGRFYFCKCAGQKTVSDEYWQSVRGKK